VAAIVIADASPLIALSRVNFPGRGGLGWLEALFGQVLVTEEVMKGFVKVHCAAPP
jgi:hypothetical protein